MQLFFEDDSEDEGDEDRLIVVLTDFISRSACSLVLLHFVATTASLTEDVFTDLMKAMPLLRALLVSLNTGLDRILKWLARPGQNEYGYLLPRLQSMWIGSSTYSRKGLMDMVLRIRENWDCMAMHHFFVTWWDRDDTPDSGVILEEVEKELLPFVQRGLVYSSKDEVALEFYSLLRL